MFSFLLSGGVAANLPFQTNDTCQYSSTRYHQERCGDKCLKDKYWSTSCQCGSARIRAGAGAGEEMCCIESGSTCSYQGENVNCSQGKVIPRSSFCPNTFDKSLECYNTYQESEFIGYKSHYSCPQSCISVRKICRGINWCESDVKACGPHLRCPEWTNTNTTKYGFNSSLVHNHHTCVIDEEYNDNKFHSIDRWDETKIDSEGLSFEININKFSPCFEDDGTPGARCGSDCKSSGGFCRGGLGLTTYSCDGMNTQDRRLCSNPLVWRNVSCEFHYSSGEVRNYGQRCTGRNMECYVPWYTDQDGWDQESCSDKSDQIFNKSLTCGEHLEINMKFHYDHFCSPEAESDVKSSLICTNKKRWLSYQEESKKDPHFCQRSCSKPGADCRACTNPDYFQCEKSGQCVHPELVCDGHPQCQEGEDENLEKCHKDYIKKQIIYPYSSYKCTSLFYKNMEIYATPCNGIVECLDHSDEDGCGDNSKINIIIVVSSLILLIIFVVLRFISANSVCRKIEPTEGLEMSIPSFSKFSIIHKDKYQHDIYDSNFVQELNLILHHSIHTKTVEEKNKRLSLVFDFLASENSYSEANTFLYMHTNLDPYLVQRIHMAKYPGITDTISNFVESIVRRPIISLTKDFINRSEKIKQFLEAGVAIVKMEMKFIDIIKDLGLSILMLELIGGPTAIINLPTNFGSAIVMVMFSSIIVPMLCSSLHLLVNNFNMFLPEDSPNSSKTKRFFRIALLFVMSPLVPVFLETHYHKVSEEARRLAQEYNIKAVQKKKECKNIKKQLISFLRIELGTHHIKQRIN